MRAVHRLGAEVALKNPLPDEPRGPWKVVAVNLNSAPPLYKLLRENKKVGKPSVIEADETELLAYQDAPMVTRQPSRGADVHQQ